MGQSITGKYAQEICKKFPEASTASLSRLLYDKYKVHYKNLQGARSIIRLYRGEMTRKLKNIKTVERIKIPPSMSETKTPWKIEPITITKALCIADVHVPFHDERALEIAINYGLKTGCKDVIINGDFFDHYQESRFLKDPAVRTFDREIETGTEILKILEDNFSGNLIFKKGNHDERYELFLNSNAPQLLALGMFSFESVHGLQKWQVIGDKRPLKAGHLYIIHGHEYRSVFSPVNPARGTFIRAYDCVLSAHNHQSSQHTGTSIGGKVISCYSQGCLCHLHPQYMPINQWQNGFATIEMDKDNFFVDNKKILKGKIY